MTHPDTLAARRRMLGYVRNRGVLDADSGALVLWTECGCGEWKADAEELSEDLMLLGVPHFTTITGPCQPPWRSASTRKPAARWEKVWITRGDLPHLLREIPSLHKTIDVTAMGDVERPIAIMRRADGRAYYAVGGEELGKVAGSPSGLGDFE
jgi:hypothetical protein